jgi:hypothetical protein
MKNQNKPNKHSTTITPKAVPKLCELKNINTFSNTNQVKYIFCEKWVQIINLEDSETTNPLLVTDWLSFLPHDFKNISSIYQGPSGEIVMFIDNMIYI